MGKRYVYYYVYNRLQFFIPPVHEDGVKGAVEEKTNVPFEVDREVVEETRCRVSMPGGDTRHACEKTISIVDIAEVH